MSRLRIVLAGLCLSAPLIVPSPAPAAHVSTGYCETGFPPANVCYVWFRGLPITLHIEGSVTSGTASVNGWMSLHSDSGNPVPDSTYPRFNSCSKTASSKVTCDASVSIGGVVDSTKDNQQIILACHGEGLNGTSGKVRCGNGAGAG